MTSAILQLPNEITLRINENEIFIDGNNESYLRVEVRQTDKPTYAWFTTLDEIKEFVAALGCVIAVADRRQNKENVASK